jgi:hypothetical protein
MSDKKHGPYQPWPPASPGHLIQEIKDAFDGADPGEYIAVYVEVNNPISGYHVVKEPAR